MRPKIIILLLSFGLIFFNSCKKKTEISGRVFSAKGIPIPNVPVDLWKYGASSYPISMYREVTKTNNEGYYYYTFKASGSHERYYKIHCEVVDSGRDDRILNKGTANNIDLKLH